MFSNMFYAAWHWNSNNLANNLDLDILMLLDVVLSLSYRGYNKLQTPQELHPSAKPQP